MSILIRNCSLLVREPGWIDRNVDVLIANHCITAIGPGLQHPAGAEVIDGTGCAVIPGLVNSHTHLYQNLIKGISPGVPLVPWCDQVLFPSLGSMREFMSQHGTRLAYLWTAIATIEMIQGGITSCVNMDSISPEIMQAWQDIGFRGVLAYTLANKWVPAELRAQEDRMKQQVVDLIEQYHQPDGLLSVFPAPSTIFLCTDEFLLWAGEVSQKYDLGMQIHVAETSGEVADQVAETRCTPVEHLRQLGLLNERLSAVHCVHVTEKDMTLLADAGVHVVHCPKSNMKLADGIAPVVTMREMGIPVSVATDGCASNDLLDMWEEIRTAVLLARVSNNRADAISPADAFAMGTTVGAAVARLNCGAIQPGKLADLAILDMRASHLRPFHAQDLMNMLVFCVKAGDVRDTIINGVTVMRDRQMTTVDEAALLEEVERIDPLIHSQRDEINYGSSNEERT